MGPKSTSGHRLFLLSALCIVLSACSGGGDSDGAPGGGGTTPTTPGGGGTNSTTPGAGGTTYTVGGTVSGLSGTVVLRNNGGNNLSISTTVSFTFAGALANASTYNVTVLTQPAGQTCAVANGAGTVSGANVANVRLTCISIPFTVGGTVTGLLGTVVLQNNGGNNLTLSANSGFTFAAPLVTGSRYSVTVLAQPAGQTCAVANGAGTVSGANVTGVTVTCPPPRGQFGQWSAVSPAPVVQLHLHLLASGKVLSWGGPDGNPPYLWDPATGVFTAVPAPSQLFCSGHAFLPDGRLLVAGGHRIDGLGTNGLGLANTNVFDPATGAWQAMPAMANGRWYPTNTALPSGEVVTIAGSDETGATVLVPEVWNGAAWRRLTSAALELPYYPRTFVAPDGRVFYAGEQQQSRYLDVAGAGRWTNGPLRKFGTRDYGSAVMYEPGKILYAGGGDPPTSTAEIIDLNQPSPTWTFTGSMASARRQINATLLPTGDVLVTGGTGGRGFNDLAGVVRSAELWHPATGTWTTLASSTVARIYHSTALLLPDGRVLYTGSGNGAGSPNELNYELYSPPYLFNGPRPTIAGALPPLVGYGQTQIVDTPDGAGIAKVTLIGLGSVTHAFDQSARLVPLSFLPVARGLSIDLPASRAVAPPGPYMLFLVNAGGVPSAGRIMLLQ